MSVQHGHQHLDPLEVLLAEDDQVLQDIFRDTMEKEARIRGTVVDGVETAIVAMAANRFGAVISDGLNGGWKTVLGNALEQEAVPVLFSLDTDAVAEARFLDIMAYEKGRTSFGLILATLVELPRR